MREAYKLIIVILLVLSGAISLNAQPSTFYFLKGVPQTKDLNPARPGIERGFYIAMPLFSKLDLSMNTNNWSYNDLIHRGTGVMADSLVWDFKKYISSLGKNNFLMESAALTLLEFGWKKDANFYAFSWSEHEFAEPFFTKSVADLLYYGNAPYLGSTFHSGYFGIGAQHYREFAFTVAKELNKKLSVGVTGKLLFGMAGIKTSGLSVVAGMPKSGDQIDLGANGRVFISAPVDIQLANNNGYQMFARNYFDANSYLTNFGNPGLAVDLGFSTKLSKKFEFSMSLIDLGFISWSKDISSFTENGHFLYRGINLNTITATNNPPTTTDVKGLFVAQRDSLRAAFFPDKSTSGFSTLLPVKLYIAGEYKANESVTWGGVARVRMFNNLIHTSLTASVNAALSKRFSLSASYSVMESTFDNLGLAAAYKIGYVQLYATSDNVTAFANPATARNMNLRVGINLIFQDVAKQRKGIYNRRPARSAPGCPLIKD
jgi:hypothetical protein